MLHENVWIKKRKFIFIIVQIKTPYFSSKPGVSACVMQNTGVLYITYKVTLKIYLSARIIITSLLRLINAVIASGESGWLESIARS